MTGSSAGKSRKGRPTKPKKVRRRLSDAEKSKENINSYQDKIRLADDILSSSIFVTYLILASP